jgi:hypothetical protein
MRVGWQRHAPAALLQGKRPVTQCIGGWVGPRSSLIGAENLVPIGIRTVQTVASNYTNWTMPSIKCPFYRVPEHGGYNGISQRIENLGAIRLPFSSHSGARPITRVYEYCLLRSGRTSCVKAGSLARIPPTPTEGKTNKEYYHVKLQPHLDWDPNTRLRILSKHGIRLF